MGWVIGGGGGGQLSKEANDMRNVINDRLSCTPLRIHVVTLVLIYIYMAYLLPLPSLVVV